MKILPLIALLIINPILVYANTTDNIQEVQHSKISPYISVKSGYSNNKLKLSGSRRQSDFSKNNSYFSLALGLDFYYNISELFSFHIETEYLHTKNHFSKTSVGVLNSIPDVKTTTSVQTKATGGLFNTYIDINLPVFVKPFIMAGVGYSKLVLDHEYTDEVVYNGYFYGRAITPNYTYSAHNFIYQLGLGFDYKVTNHITLDAEYRYLNYGSVNISDYYKFKQIYNQLLFGIRYTF